MQIEVIDHEIDEEKAAQEPRKNLNLLSETSIKPSQQIIRHHASLWQSAGRDGGGDGGRDGPEGRRSNHVWVYSATFVYCSKKCASLKPPEKSQNSAFSYTENKRHLSARIGLRVLLYGSKRHLGNGTEMELRSALSAFLSLHFFFVPFHLCLLSVPCLPVPFLRTFSLCLFSPPCHSSGYPLIHLLIFRFI
jgi:hypothetical protein